MESKICLYIFINHILIKAESHSLYFQNINCQVHLKTNGLKWKQSQINLILLYGFPLSSLLSLSSNFTIWNSQTII